MNAAEVPTLFDVTFFTLETLQELQVILGLDQHETPGQALETSLVWYDDAGAQGNALRFEPPPTQATWRAYTRRLEVDPALPPVVEVHPDRVRVQAEGRERLIASDSLFQLATPQGFEQIVRLRIEAAVRRADDWKIEVETDKGATP